MLKNRARFFLILCGTVNTGSSPLPKHITLSRMNSQIPSGRSEYAAVAKRNRTAHLASGFSDPPVLVVILRFYRRLALSYAPQVPPEHNQNCESDHTGQGELRDIHNIGCVVIPGFLKGLVTPNERLAIKASYVRDAERTFHRRETVVYKEKGRNEQIYPAPAVSASRLVGAEESPT